MEPLGNGDPRRIGRFRLVGLLGTGGMGRVFLGRSPDGTAVAVKVVHPHLLAGDQGEFRARFAREVRAARQVDPAFTARVVAADVDAQVPWLATEFVAGLTLSEAVERFGPLPEESLLVLGSGLFAALAGIHASGLVHRDIKPSNIMLGVDGPKVIDFGIARPAEATGLTRTGQTVGTWGFMSPEQFERSDVGPESDVFSAGAVLAYAGTGRLPFPGDTLPVLFANLTTRAPELDGLYPALAPMVEAALAKTPATRPTAAAARKLIPAPPTHVGADRGWLPPAVTHAILRAASTVLSTPAPSDAAATRGAADGSSLVRETRRPEDGNRHAVPQPSSPSESIGNSISPPAAPTPRDDVPPEPSDPAVPFSVAWTGDEPLSGYADSSTRDFLQRLSGTVAAVTPPGILVPLLLHRIETGTGQEDGWMAWFVLSTVFGLFAIGTLLWLTLVTYLQRKPKGWSLRIGPHGIATTDVNGEREYPWSHVQATTIEEIQASTRYLNGRLSPYAYSGLHAQFTVDNARSAPSAPAGWPPWAPGRITTRKAGIVPICVLGPMPDHQRTELNEALARYGALPSRR